MEHFNFFFFPLLEIINRRQKYQRFKQNTNWNQTKKKMELAIPRPKPQWEQQVQYQEQ